MIEIPQYLGHFINGWPTKGVFTSGGLPFVLRPDDITEGFAVIAQRGAGKSNTAGVMEEIFSSMGDQWIAIDPAAAHIGIRNARTKDGRPKGPSGLPVLIVGGEKGDFPLNPKGGKELAQILMETKISCVIDLKNTTTNDKKHFLTELGSELLAKNKTPIHLFLDEADEIIPQQPDNKEEQEIRAVWRKVIKRGRSSGLGFTILSQRAAMVDKTSLYQIQNLVVMQLSGAGDLDMIKGWFKHNTYSNEHMEEILTAMTSLKTGEAFLLSPKVFGGIFRIQVRERVTFHAGRTPKRGEQPIEVKKYEIKEIAALFQSKLEEKKVAIADERDRAAKLNQELTELRRKVAEFQTAKPVAQKRDPEAEAKKIAQIVERALKGRDRIWTGRVREYQKNVSESVRGALSGFTQKLSESAGVKFEYPTLTAEDLAQYEARESLSSAPTLRPASTLKPAPVATPSSPETQGTNGVDPKPLRQSAIQALRIMAGWPDGLTEGMLGAQLGLKTYGGGWNFLRKSILDPGYAVVQGGRYKITDEGMRLIGQNYPPPATDTEDVLRRWEGKIRDSSMSAVRKLVEIYPSGMTREQLAECLRLQPKGGGWNVLMRQIQDSGLATLSGNEILANKENLLL